MTHKSRITRHKLPRCHATGLDRYRDRHQARQGAAARGRADRQHKWVTFACPECRGFHLEKLRQHSLGVVGSATQDLYAPVCAPRRYILVDIENMVAGRATRSEAQALWRELVQRSPGITAKDHVVIGGNRYAAKKFSTAIAGDNIKWVVGAETPDGADRALLAATNPHQIAKRYDELVIMSGDHAFTDLAWRAKDLGLRVHVVATKRSRRESSLSRQLAAAADLHTTVLLEGTRPRVIQSAQKPAA